MSPWVNPSMKNLISSRLSASFLLFLIIISTGRMINTFRGRLFYFPSIDLAVPVLYPARLNHQRSADDQFIRHHCEKKNGQIHTGDPVQLPGEFVRPLTPDQPSD